MTESLSKNGEPSKEFTDLWQKAVRSQSARDDLDSFGIHVSLAEEEVDWLTKRLRATESGQIQELAATFLGQPYLMLPSECATRLIEIASDKSGYPPAIFRAAVALWNHGINIDDAHPILQAVAARNQEFLRNTLPDSIDSMVVVAEDLLHREAVNKEK